MEKNRKLEDGVDLPAAACDDVLEITRSKRDAPPTDYILKIKSFSQWPDLFCKTGKDKYESSDFEAGGYRWKLLLYPNGNAKKNGNDHISLYLALAESNTVSGGFQIDVIFKLFVYDQIRDKYLTIQDGIVKRYHALKTKHGFDQLLPRKTFNDSCNGYLVNDCCAFGAEVQVLKHTGKGEEISFSRNPQSGNCTWKLDRFSTLGDNRLSSEPFTAANYKWKLMLYPKGDSREKNRSLSLFMMLDDDNLEQKVYVEYKMWVKSQGDEGWNHNHERSGNQWFSKSMGSWGYSSFVLLSELGDKTKGFLVNDTLIIEAEVTVVYAAKGLSLK